MLINAQRPEEIRVAIATDAILDNYQVAVAEADLTRGNIYRGVVASVQPALNAAFIEYGAARHAFLAADDVVPQARHRQPPEGARHPRIDQILERGKPILVQVSKEGGDIKGAAVTTNVSLAGRYLVAMPFDDMRGISRKLEDETVRKELRSVVDKLDVPEGLGFIVRTSAVGQSKTTLNRDLNAVLRLWKRIRNDMAVGKGPRLLYNDQDLVIQAVRDYLDSSVDEVLVDDDGAFEKVQTAMRAFMPRAKVRLTRYRERVPLFSQFGLEDQIDSIFKRAVGLPAGGSIVIDGTEALTAIDVNSGKAMRGASHEETITAINLEAAAEVARQLRLRDIGGLIVVDFIDMRSSRHRQAVERTLRDAMKPDKARATVGRISPNGLLEINRQRIKQSLFQRTHRSCPTCGGAGRIPSPETVSLNLLRRIEARAATGGIRGVTVRLHPELADAIQNGRRQELAAIEREFGIRIEIIAATSLHRSQEEVAWQEGAPAARKEAEVRVGAAQVLDLTTGGAPTTEPRIAGGEEVGRKKSRRRGGRRRRKNGQAEAGLAEAASVAPGASVDEPADVAEGASAQRPGTGDEVPGTEARPKARKRRRRKRPLRNEGDGSAPLAARSSEPAPSEGQTAAEPTGGAAGEPRVEDKAAEGTVKKRRRRPRKSATPDASVREGETREEAASGGADPAVAAGGTGEAPRDGTKTAVSGRKRRRKPKAASAAGDREAGEGDASREGTVVQSDSASEEPGQVPPEKASRGSRRRRRKPAKAADTTLQVGEEE